MKCNKILSVVGVRPHFVKLAALHSFLSQNFQHVIVHTGQHYDYEMSRAFFECLKLPNPDYNLDVGSGLPGCQIGEMWKRTEDVLLKEKPDIVIVYGDTNSTLAGALAAVKLHIKTAHVEAGYRSYDKQMPEEVNRLLTDQMSDLLFAPTKTSIRNLGKENIQGQIHLTGDVMVDVLLNYKETAENKSKILDKLGIKPKEYLLMTIHRESNTDIKETTIGIFNALLSIDDYQLVFPIHPRTKKALQCFGLYGKLEQKENFRLIEPLNYLDFVKLEKNASKILTDSGGVQKEAYLLGVPCITLRDTTEVIETVQEGWNRLTASDPTKILAAVKNFNPNKLSPRRSLGEGDAAKKIIELLKS